MSDKNLTIDLDIVTLDKSLYSGTVKQIEAPTKMGKITVLPRHIPLITTLEPGELRLKVNEGEGIYAPDMIFIAIGGGFMEVQPGNRVSVIADSAERVDEIDEERAIAAKEKAEKLLKEFREGKSKITEQEFASAAAQLARALTRLKVVRRKRKK